MDAAGALVYLVPLIVVSGVYLHFRQRSEERSIRVRTEAFEAGLGEPASLHPVIDPAKCMGCGACVGACPEGDILGLINGKADLIEPSRCIGHGECARNCPFGAISLVFGTERRGVDIPVLGADFQTGIPGIYIAGELGGMGLIRNAIEQGRQAMDAVAKTVGSSREGVYDVVVVGAGPAGFSASLAAKQKGLTCLTIEQDTLGGTVSHYPRGKLVMTQPAQLPIFGKVRFREMRKEDLLSFWRRVERETGLSINYEERLEGVDAQDGVFQIRTSKGTYRCQKLLLAIGRRGTPRTLDVPGEDLPKSVYRMIDPAQYAGRNVLVVGGGDSALEAAAEIAEQPGAHVTLSYRGEAFSRAKPKNRTRIEEAQAAGCASVLLESNVIEICETEVLIEQEGKSLKLPNDDVIICAGGILPTNFLRSIGIEVETQYGVAPPRPTDRRPRQHPDAGRRGPAASIESTSP